MTRAKKKLYISWNTGYSYMQDAFKTPSRFCMEIPSEFIYSEQKEEEKKPEKTYTTQTLTGKKTSVRTKVRLRKGDVVEHTIYGQGVVLEVRDMVATIAFGHTIGVKKLNAGHPSLKKV